MGSWSDAEIEKALSDANGDVQSAADACVHTHTTHTHRIYHTHSFCTHMQLTHT